MSEDHTDTGSSRLKRSFSTDLRDIKLSTEAPRKSNNLEFILTGSRHGHMLDMLGEVQAERVSEYTGKVKKSFDYPKTRLPCHKVPESAILQSSDYPNGVSEHVHPTDASDMPPYVVTTHLDFRSNPLRATNTAKPYAMKDPAQPRPLTGRCDSCWLAGSECYDQVGKGRLEYLKGSCFRIEGCKACFKGAPCTWTETINYLESQSSK